MCGGTRKLSQAELTAQDTAARARAQAEADKARAMTDLEKQKASDTLMADRVATANADQVRRTRNRSLLAGLQSEEGMGLEDPNSNSTKKRKLATLLAKG